MRFTIDSNNVWNRPFRKFLDRFICPCCNYPTLTERNSYDICGLCDWEDDGQDDEDADKVYGGPNSDYSVTESRNNFRTHLTMYRPTDTISFSRQNKERISEIKEVYDKILSSTTMDIEEIQKQLRLAERLEDKLLKDKMKDN